MESVAKLAATCLGKGVSLQRPVGKTPRATGLKPHSIPPFKYPGKRLQAMERSTMLIIHEKIH